MDSIQLASRSPTKAEAVSRRVKIGIGKHPAMGNLQAETKRIVKQDSILNCDESNKATIVAKSLQAN